MDKSEGSKANKTIQVEEIMEAIRRQLAERPQTSPTESPLLSAPDGPLPSAFYQHLHQARLAHDRIEPRVQLTQSTVPIVGGLLQTLRQKLHELVLFYVNQLAANQIRVNAHLLEALTILSQELEKNEGDRG